MNHSLCLGAALGLCATQAVAQTTLPDAGSVIQQIEQTRVVPLPPAAPDAPGTQPARPATGPSGTTVTVREFRLSGATLVDEAVLRAALARFTGRPIDFVELQRAADAVVAAYREAGLLARAVLPAQTIDAGVVELRIVEARFGGARVEGEPARRVESALVERYIAAQQRTGEPLRLDAVDRGLLLADDLPGVGVAGTLVPGPGEGQSSIVLRTVDEPRLFGDVTLDNHGARSTGAVRGLLNASLANPGGHGELLGLSALRAEGLNYGRLAFSAPVGLDGLRLGVNVTALTFEVVNGPGAGTATPIQGRSSAAGLDLSYPLVRERLRNVYLQAALDTRRFFTEDAQVRADYRTDALRVGLSANRFDDFAGGGANSAQVSVLAGRVGDIAAHPLNDRLDGAYRKVTYAFSRQQTLTTRHALLFSLQGQHASRPLDSSEKFYIGGPASVRAYPVSELGGDRGQLASLEWRWRLATTLVAAAFVDHGRVVTLPTTSGTPPTALSLTGHGLTLSWQAPRSVNVRLTWSQRQGSHPRPTSAGTDGDGTLRLNRYWISASLPF